ncbi:MAG: RNA 2',3'-cyclic phosphodiesterase [Treponema sp.]|jgi:2'-5' RNA ligase|nr:RNA 2',3'-cyclic phosphodiesterase [Treponema sp.]
MRLFIAVNFNETVKERILEVQAGIRAQASRGNFSRRENLHLSLAFLGETPEDRLPLIRSCMEALRGPPFTLTFNHTGCFSRGGKELWWLGAEEGPGMNRLREIRRRLCTGLLEAALAFDGRPFKAHITLGREIRSPVPVRMPPVNIGVPVERISLMLSEHRTAGSIPAGKTAPGSSPTGKKLLVYTELYGQSLRFAGV